MQINPYLSFKGDCEAAFSFYADCFGGTVGELFRYAGSPMASEVPADWQQKVMHATVTIAGQAFMGGDVAPDRYERPQGFSMSIQLNSVARAEQIFQMLAKDGTVRMPLEKTFWAERFGMVVDRYGIPWLINCEASV
jgi:PhnB protein